MKSKKKRQTKIKRAKQLKNNVVKQKALKRQRRRNIRRKSER